jgi:hypothetical protein
MSPIELEAAAQHADMAAVRTAVAALQGTLRDELTDMLDESGLDATGGGDGGGGIVSAGDGSEGGSEGGSGSDTCSNSDGCDGGGGDSGGGSSELDARVAELVAEETAAADVAAENAEAAGRLHERIGTARRYPKASAGGSGNNGGGSNDDDDDGGGGGGGSGGCRFRKAAEFESMFKEEKHLLHFNRLMCTGCSFAELAVYGACVGSAPWIPSPHMNPAMDSVTAYEPHHGFRHCI